MHLLHALHGQDIISIEYTTLSALSCFRRSGQHMCMRNALHRRALPSQCHRSHFGGRLQGLTLPCRFIDEKSVLKALLLA